MEIKHYQKGKEDALRDLESNKLILKTFGRQASWSFEWKRLLEERYGIEIVVIAGCIVSEEEIEYVKGYNDISVAEIEKRLGKDVLDKTSDDAMMLWKVEPFEQIINENPEVEAIVNSADWVKCPNCNISFKITSAVSWNGKMHLSCQQKIRLINLEK